MKTALLSGITGQDGAYLAQFLLSKGYSIHGIYRRASVNRFERIEHLSGQVTLHQADLTDQSSLNRLISSVRPDEVYNLAAQSFVGASWDSPVSTGDITGLGVTRILEAIRQEKPDAKFYQASSSEMFGHVREVPQKETTPFYPRSPYGAAKAYGHYIAVNYRESHGIFACSGILFNHESPLRGTEFVTRKITHAVARIAAGRQSELRLGNLDALRDWGHAKDYVEAMWMMLQHDVADDYVVGTGEMHSVLEFVELAFARARLDWRKFVIIDPAFIRPAEVHQLQGDCTKIRTVLGWKPKTSFQELVNEMVDADIDQLNHELYGHR